MPKTTKRRAWSNIVKAYYGGDLSYATLARLGKSYWGPNYQPIVKRKTTSIKPRKLPPKLLVRG